MYSMRHVNTISFFGANFLNKCGFTTNYNDNVLQWVDHKIPLKDPNEIFDNHMFIDLNEKICQTDEDNMFNQVIVDSYAACILDGKYQQVDTNKVAADQNQ